jgi:hypothetical protein
MPILFLAVGIALLIAAIRNTLVTNGSNPGLFTLLQQDFTSSNNFGIWILAIVILGALGYVPALRLISNGLLLLIVVVILLSNKGFFSQFQSAVVAA